MRVLRDVRVVYVSVEESAPFKSELLSRVLQRSRSHQRLALGSVRVEGELALGVGDDFDPEAGALGDLDEAVLRT